MKVVCTKRVFATANAYYLNVQAQSVVWFLLMNVHRRLVLYLLLVSFNRIMHTNKPSEHFVTKISPFAHMVKRRKHICTSLHPKRFIRREDSKLQTFCVLLRAILSRETYLSQSFQYLCVKKVFWVRRTLRRTARRVPDGHTKTNLKT